MADKKITDLAAAAALTGAELLEGVQSGGDVKLTTAAIAALATPAVVTEATTARTALPAHAGTYVRFTNTAAKTWTFDGGQTWVAGTEFHARNVGANNLTLTPTGGFAFTAPYLGTLVVPPGGTVTVKITADDAADVFGVTV